MKTLKQIISESDYTDPKAPADKAFVDKHVIQKTDYPHKPKDGSNDDIFSGKKQKRKKKKTDHEDEKAVYEMSEIQKKKKEDIVKGMKKNTSDFISRYGKDAESVMHATANKMAQEEADIWGEIDASEEEIVSLMAIHETLNDANKEEFEQRIQTPEGLQAMIEFATKLSGE